MGSRIRIRQHRERRREAYRGLGFWRGSAWSAGSIASSNRGEARLDEVRASASVGDLRVSMPGSICYKLGREANMGRCARAKEVERGKRRGRAHQVASESGRDGG
jgi:hypothetical protein